MSRIGYIQFPIAPGKDGFSLVIGVEEDYIIRMKRLLIIMIMTLMVLGGLTADRKDVDTVDLEKVGKDRLLLGLSVGYPLSGITAGWKAGDGLELDATLGALNYNYLSLGAAAMISVVNLEMGGEIFPLKAGPFVYAGFGSRFFGLGAGAMARMEYTFDFPLNLYLEGGVMLEAFDLNDGGLPLGFPVSLGARYVF